MTRGQLRATVRWESMIIALFGTAMGLSIGLFFGWSIVHALADQGFKAFVVPTGSLLVVAVIAAIAGVAAAVLPAAGRPGSTCWGQSPPSDVASQRAVPPPGGGTVASSGKSSGIDVPWSSGTRAGGCRPRSG